VTTKTANRREGEKLTAQTKRAGRVTSTDLKQLADAQVDQVVDKLAVKEDPKGEQTPKATKAAKPKAEGPDDTHDPEVIELVAALAIEVANDQGEFTAADVEKFVGMGTWATIVAVMRQNPGVFLRESKNSKWTLAVNGAQPAVSEEEEEAVEVAEE